MALSDQAREAICAVSTKGRDSYYPTTDAFFARLEWALRKHGFSQSDLRYPLIHTSQGRALQGVVKIGGDEELFDVVYTWHRKGLNWEMLCYPSC